MERQIIITADGSATIHMPGWQESYHSRHGAIQEARHVFLANGFDLFPHGPVHILEIGFGTGLNALLTLQSAIETSRQVFYTGIEAFPISADEARAMNFTTQPGLEKFAPCYLQMHEAPSYGYKPLHPFFNLRRREQRFEQLNDVCEYDLVYFDAFGYRVQPELWSEDIFRRMYLALKPSGLLVTYAARSVIRRNMEASGFRVVKRPGPIGKREMFVAFKDC